MNFCWNDKTFRQLRSAKTKKIGLWLPERKKILLRNKKFWWRKNLCAEKFLRKKKKFLRNKNCRPKRNYSWKIATGSTESQSIELLLRMMLLFFFLLVPLIISDKAHSHQWQSIATQTAWKSLFSSQLKSFGAHSPNYAWIFQIIENLVAGINYIFRASEVFPTTWSFFLHFFRSFFFLFFCSITCG